MVKLENLANVLSVRNFFKGNEMTAAVLPSFEMEQTSWDKLNKEATRGTLKQLLSGELSAAFNKPRSRSGQIVFGMSSYIGLLCTYDVPFSTQITLLRRWVRWGFDVTRTTYIRHVREMIGEEEYLSFQKRAWLCQRFERVKEAKNILDISGVEQALKHLAINNVVGEFSHKFGNNSVEVTAEDAFGFMETYERRGFFVAASEVKGMVSYERFKKLSEKYLSQIFGDIGKLNTVESILEREHEFMKHEANGTSVLSGIGINVNAVVNEAKIAASESIKQVLPELEKTQVQPLPIKETNVKKKPPTIIINDEEYVDNKSSQKVLDVVLMAENGKTVAEPYWAFCSMDEADGFKEQIKVGDLVIVYGIGGKFHCYRKYPNSEYVLVKKDLSMNQLMQEAHENRRYEIKPRMIGGIRLDSISINKSIAI